MEGHASAWPLSTYMRTRRSASLHRRIVTCFYFHLLRVSRPRVMTTNLRIVPDPLHPCIASIVFVGSDLTGETVLDPSISYTASPAGLSLLGAMCRRRFSEYLRGASCTAGTQAPRHPGTQAPRHPGKGIRHGRGLRDITVFHSATRRSFAELYLVV